MAQEDTLRVKLYTNGPDEEPDTHYVEYVSLVTNGTYGPPPLVAPSRDGNIPTAEYHETVLYINTSLVPAFSITRLDEDVEDDE